MEEVNNQKIETSASDKNVSICSEHNSPTTCNCCNHKTKKRDEKEYKDLCNRLNRIEGQVRGVKRMLDEDYYCVDILTQVSAINAALKAFSCKLLENHINSCVVDHIEQGDMEVVPELVALLKKML